MLTSLFNASLSKIDSVSNNSANTSNNLINNRLFNWQSHSYNDLRLYPQLLKKKNKLFKVDFHYVEDQRCSNSFNYSSILPTSKPFLKDSIISSTTNQSPCFLLSHDNPLQSVQYFSSNSLLEFILNDESIQYFKDNNTSIALCIKNAPATKCDDTKFINLMDDFYLNANNIIKQHNLKIQFILDGAKFSCAVDKWILWPYTWIRGEDADDAFYSDDATKFYNRYQIFNDDEANLEADAKLSFGKFLTNYNNPLQLWEPSDQDLILKHARTFKTVPYKFGYAYAINIDPVMFQVYAAQESNEATNKQLFKYEKDSIVTKFAVIANTTRFDDSLYLLTASISKYKLDEVNLKLYTLDITKQGVFNEFKLIEEIDMKLDYDIKEFREFIYMDTLMYSNSMYYFLLDGANGIHIIELNLLKLKLNDIKINKKSNFNVFDEEKESSKLNYYISNIYHRNNFINYNIINLITAVKIDNNNIEFRVFEYDMNTQKKRITKIDTIPFTYEITSFKVFINKVLNEYFGILLFKVDEQIKSMLLKLNKYNKVKVMYKPFYNFGVGDNPSLSLLNDNFSVSYDFRFILVKENSFCYNNHRSNTIATVKVCDQKEVKNKSVLNYYYGKIDYDDIESQFKENPDLDMPLVNPCFNGNIISGSYDMGKNPHIQIISKYNRVNIIEMHEGITNEEDFDKTCGISSFFKGAVLDSWEVE